MSSLRGPVSTTTVAPSTTPAPDKDGGWGHLLWIPYVVLTLILVLLACISFMHYHFKNRGKYMDAIYKPNTVTSCPRKYRVTLNRKGFVAGTLFSANRNLITGHRVGAAGSDVTKHDIFIVSNADCCVADVATGSGSRTRMNHNYENEAYDRESSQGSDKSLLNRNSDSLRRADVILDVESRARDVTDVARQSTKGGFRMIGVRYKARDHRPEAASGSEIRHDTKPSKTTKKLSARRDSDKNQKKTGSRAENHPKQVTVTPVLENRGS